MDKLFLWIAVASAFVLQSCEKTDGIRDEIAILGDRVAALEEKVAGVNRDIVALHKLMDESTVIVGVTPTPTGYDLELSDGTTLPVVLGEELEALVPQMGIDNEGYWTVSLDNGATTERLLIDGAPVSAWPTQGGEHKPGAEGVTPELKIDDDGTWLVSTDGVTFTPLLLDGEKINALGDKVVISYSIFKNVVYDAAEGILTIELSTGGKLTLGVEDTFSLTIAAQAEEPFLPGETRAFEVEQRGVAAATLRAPAGWTAVLEESLLTVTAPRTSKAETEAVEIAVIATSETGYIRIAKLNILLLNPLK